MAVEELSRLLAASELSARNSIASAKYERVSLLYTITLY